MICLLEHWDYTPVRIGWLLINEGISRKRKAQGSRNPEFLII